MKAPRVCILATKPDGVLIEMDSRFRGNDGSLIYATVVLRLIPHLNEHFGGIFVKTFK